MEAKTPLAQFVSWIENNLRGVRSIIMIELTLRVDLQLLIGFLTASVALALMPGPDNIYVLTESISKGWRQGVGITTGLVSGVLIHTTLVATGLSVIVFESEMAFNILKVLGTLYLLYMAYGAFKEPAMNVEIGPLSNREPLLKLVRKGFWMNVLNPKVTLFFMVLLPQFVSNDVNAWSPMVQMIILGLVFILCSFLVFSGIALVAGSLAAVIKNPRFWVITKWIKVVVLIALALVLVMSRV
ncbi:MAG TPA: lysine transporter LysE [Flavobacteriales bacterium]|mgnify:CR=1 FL=1|nr:LysE family translocator [Flavobacteriales bacterium]HAW21018.1 lysine transporter LysE [Flavobacteriales bacterium]